VLAGRITPYQAIRAATLFLSPYPYFCCSRRKVSKSLLIPLIIVAGWDKDTRSVFAKQMQSYNDVARKEKSQIRRFFGVPCIVTETDAPLPTALRFIRAKPQSRTSTPISPLSPLHGIMTVIDASRAAVRLATHRSLCPTHLDTETIAVSDHILFEGTDKLTESAISMLEWNTRLLTSRARLHWGRPHTHVTAVLDACQFLSVNVLTRLKSLTPCSSTTRNTPGTIILDIPGPVQPEKLQTWLDLHRFHRTNLLRVEGSFPLQGTPSFHRVVQGIGSYFVTEDLRQSGEEENTGRILLIGRHLSGPALATQVRTFLLS